MADFRCVDVQASGGDRSRMASMGPRASIKAVSVVSSPVIWRVWMRFCAPGPRDILLFFVTCAFSLDSEDSLRPMAITRAPMAMATSTAAPPKFPVAGHMSTVSPGERLMSRRPPYGTSKWLMYMRSGIE